MFLLTLTFLLLPLSIEREHVAVGKGINSGGRNFRLIKCLQTLVETTCAPRIAAER